MSWHIFEKLLEKVANYSPFVGKVWIVFVFLFRLIIVTSIGDTIYEDEQEEFECNTNDPGCTQFCFTLFTPVSQIRFFAMHLLFVGTPSMMFIVYTLHKITYLPSTKETKSEDSESKSKKLARQRARRRRQRMKYIKSLESQNLPNYVDIQHPETKGPLVTQEVKVVNGKLQKIPMSLISTDSEQSSTETDVDKDKGTEKDDEKNSKVKTKTVHNQNGSEEVVKTPAIARAYIIHAILRLLVEAGFIYLQYCMYGFHVPWFYDCSGEPCTKIIRCYVSRPKEKTYLLLFMYATAFLSLALNIIEIVVIAIAWVKQKVNKSTADPTLESVLPMNRAIHNNRHNRRRYVHPGEMNTFPTLGPYPLKRDNRVGGSSCNVIVSDHEAYVY